jgi:hypothetical protein
MGYALESDAVRAAQKLIAESVVSISERNYVEANELLNAAISLVISASKQARDICDHALLKKSICCRCTKFVETLETAEVTAPSITKESLQRKPVKRVNTISKKLAVVA